ncbi:hypothetical protein V5O48_001930 [Marasmius crinis-equi]|uniref:Uncharacterized protein n=1 Tax=Marasmius crinis-equi TaxID=585013 RepID=A0ABR3FX09_9AGAR
MGNLRLQNELPRHQDAGVDKVLQQDDEQLYEEDYVRTESYFASEPQKCANQPATQPVGIHTTASSTRSTVKRLRIDSDDSIVSEDGRNASAGSMDLSLPLSDSIIPETFDTSGELGRNDSAHLATGSSSYKVASSPTITNLSDALSRISLQEPRSKDKDLDLKKRDGESENTSQFRGPRGISAARTPAGTIDMVGSAVAQATQHNTTALEGPNATETHTEAQNSHPQATLEKPDSRRSQNCHRHRSSRDGNPIVDSQPPRSHSRRRRKRRSGRNSAVASDVEDGGIAESSVDKKKVRRRGQSPLPASHALRSGTAPSTLPISDRGLSSSRWAPRTDRPSPPGDAVSSKSDLRTRSRTSSGMQLSNNMEEPGSSLCTVELKQDPPLSSDLFTGNRAALDSSPDSGVRDVDPRSERPSALQSSGTRATESLSGLTLSSINPVLHSRAASGNIARPPAGIELQPIPPASNVDLPPSQRAIHALPPQRSGPLQGHFQFHLREGVQIPPPNAYPFDDEQIRSSSATGPLRVPAVPVGQVPPGAGQLSSFPEPRDNHHYTLRGLQYPPHTDPLIEYWRRVYEACGDLRHTGPIPRSDASGAPAMDYSRTEMRPIDTNGTRDPELAFQSSAPRHLRSDTHEIYHEGISHQSWNDHDMADNEGWFMLPQRRAVRMERPPDLSGLPMQQMQARRIRPVNSMPLLNQQLSANSTDADRRLVVPVHQGNVYPVRNDLQGSLSPWEQHLRIPIHTTSEEGFHNNPPPPQMMNIPQESASRAVPSVPATVGSPQIPEKDFNSKIHDSRARPRRLSVARRSAKEEPVQDHQTSPADIIAGAPPGKDETRSKDDHDRDAATSEERSQKKPFPSAFNVPAPQLKSKDALSWRTARNVSAPVALNAKRSMPALKYVPPPARSLVKNSQAGVPLTAPEVPDAPSGATSSQTGVSVTPLGGACPRVNSPPPSHPRSADAGQEPGQPQAKENGPVRARARARSGTVSAGPLKSTAITVSQDPVPKASTRSSRVKR